MILNKKEGRPDPKAPRPPHGWILQIYYFFHYLQTKSKKKNEKYGIKGIVHGNIAVSAVQDQLEKQQEARRPSSGRRASAFHARGASPSRGSHYRHPTPSGMPTIRPTGGTVDATPYR